MRSSGFTLIVVILFMLLPLSGIVGYYIGNNSNSQRDTLINLPTPIATKLDYPENSREACLDKLRQELDIEFKNVIAEECSSTYLDPLCKFRIESLSQITLEEKAEHCITTTKP